MENMTDSTWIQIWHDIKDGGAAFYIFLALFFITSFKEQFKDIFKAVFDLLTFRLLKKKQMQVEYTKKDIDNHPLFKQLNFWLDYGIDAIHFKGTFQLGNIGNIHSHPETEDYYLAKEGIAKDLIRTKFELIKTMYTEFVADHDFNNVGTTTLKKYLHEFFNKCRTAQYNKLCKTIPEIFLQKYVTLEKPSTDCLLSTIETYFEPTFEIDNTTRIYLALTAIETYLNNVFNNISTTVNAINGDLNGIEYNGKVIGFSSDKKLKPPHSTYPMIVLEMLTNIMAEFRCSRAYVHKFYNVDDNGDYYNSLISCVYEHVAKGVTSELIHLQKLCANRDLDAIRLLCDGTIIASDISKFNSQTIEQLNRRGIKGVIMVPIFNYGKLDGLLMLDYLSLDAFHKSSNNPEIDEKLLNYAQKIAPYIIYPKDFNFSM